MSDLSLQLQQATSQLPVSSYFSEALFQRELELLYKYAPRYVGHDLSVPNVGDYFALPQEGEGRALLRTPQGVELISNVCRHRQAVILRGRGSLHDARGSGSVCGGGGNIVCPLHRWTYSGGNGSVAGSLLGAPHFAQDPCMNLKNYPLQNWNGLLFDPPSPNSPRSIAQELGALKPHPELDFSGHVLDRVEMHECNYNWKTFIEVYLEDYHVGPFHPGLGGFVTCEDLRWDMGEHCSVQTVGLASHQRRAGTPIYQRWQDALDRYSTGASPRHGATWLTYFPNVMVEWYPHVLTVSTLHPMGPRKTLNMVEFFYSEEITAFEREFVEAQQAAYMETCKEDDEIAERMDAGRQALMQRGDDEAGPYQSPMEDGMQHFHEWYRKQMGEHVGPCPRDAVPAP